MGWPGGGRARRRPGRAVSSTGAALRDVANNPVWAFVREGPTWHGRRVAGWDELFE